MAEKKCVHHYHLEPPKDEWVKGVCEHCGEEALFPVDGKAPKQILKKGTRHAATAPPAPAPAAAPPPAAAPAPEPALAVEPAPESKAARPEGWEGWNKRQRGRWYREHRDEIMADVERLGEKATAELWHMPFNTLHGHLVRPPRVPRVKPPPVIVEPVEKPEGWGCWSTIRRSAWYREHLDAIRADQETLGFGRTCLRWGMPGSSLSYLFGKGERARERALKHLARGKGEPNLHLTVSRELLERLSHVAQKMGMTLDEAAEFFLGALTARVWELWHFLRLFQKMGEAPEGTGD